MKIKVRYSKQAKKFLDKNTLLSEKEIENFATLAVKKIILNENVNLDLIALKGNLKGFYRVRTGKIRIIFELKNEDLFIIFFAQNIDYRGNVYN